MSEHLAWTDTHTWENLSPEQVLATLVYEVYSPVSLLSSHLNRLTDDNDPLTEEEYESLFEQMQTAVRQLSILVVNLKRYTQEHQAGTSKTE